MGWFLRPEEQPNMEIIMKPARLPTDAEAEAIAELKRHNPHITEFYSCRLCTVYCPADNDFNPSQVVGKTGVDTDWDYIVDFLPKDGVATDSYIEVDEIDLLVPLKTAAETLTPDDYKAIEVITRHQGTDVVIFGLPAGGEREGDYVASGILGEVCVLSDKPPTSRGRLQITYSNANGRIITNGGVSPEKLTRLGTAKDLLASRPSPEPEIAEGLGIVRWDHEHGTTYLRLEEHDRTPLLVACDPETGETISRGNILYFLNSGPYYCSGLNKEVPFTSAGKLDIRG